MAVLYSVSQPAYLSPCDTFGSRLHMWSNCQPMAAPEPTACVNERPGEALSDSIGGAAYLRSANMNVGQQKITAADHLDVSLSADGSGIGDGDLYTKREFFRLKQKNAFVWINAPSALPRDTRCVTLLCWGGMAWFHWSSLHLEWRLFLNDIKSCLLALLLLLLICVHINPWCVYAAFQ